MKQIFSFMLVVPLVFTMISLPGLVSANYDKDDYDKLEIEAEIFTDITVIKVEYDDKKTVSTSTARTREGVIKAVVDRFGFTEAEVEAVLELDMEDRASRPQDLGKLNKYIKKDKNRDRSSTSTPAICRDDDDRLEIDADVFSDKTVVRVELVNARDEVFTTSTTTRAGVVEAIAEKYRALTKVQIEEALDFEVEDRASRPRDLVVDSECKNWSKPATTTNMVNEAKLAELRARIVELQALLDQLVMLLRKNQ